MGRNIYSKTIHPINLFLNPGVLHKISNFIKNSSRQISDFYFVGPDNVNVHYRFKWKIGIPDSLMGHGSVIIYRSFSGGFMTKISAGVYYFLDNFLWSDSV
jgi:hypothetical protein